MKNLLFLVLLIVFSAFSCQEKPKSFTDQEKATIQQFATQLEKSINAYQYELLHSAWDNDLFKQQLGGLTSTDRTILNYAYEKDYADYLQLLNASEVNTLKYNNGRIYLSNIQFVHNQAVLSFSRQYENIVDFIRYKVVLKGLLPKLCDFSSLKEDSWESENLRQSIKFYAQYQASSEVRQLANRALGQLESTIVAGNYDDALLQINNLPPVPIPDRRILLKKIQITNSLSDSLYGQTLEQAVETDDGLFFQYLYHYYYEDSLALEQVFQKLATKTKEEALIDSLRTGQYFWY